MKMTKTRDTVIDIASTLMAAAVLGWLGDPWWAYGLILVFGACQQFIGRYRGKHDMMRKIMSHNGIAVVLRAGAPKEGG